MLDRDILGPWDVHLTPHSPPHIWACPHDWSLKLLYLHYFYKAALRNYFTNLHTRGWDGPPTPSAPRACNSEPSACTSMASSGSPSSSRVEHKVEWSESNHGSSKARGCSASIMDAHSHDRHCGLASPCPRILSLGCASGFDSPHPSTSLPLPSSGSSPSSCVCSPSFSEEESSVQARRWHIPSSVMQSTSWGAHGTKFANATAILSSTQLRSLATPMGGHPLHLVPGGIVCQDAPFVNEGPCHA